MKFFSSNKFSFLLEAYTGQPQDLLCCERIYTTTGDTIWEAPATCRKLPMGSALYSVRNFPSYLQIQCRENRGFFQKSYPTLKNFAILMEGHESAEAYMLAQFSRKSRGNIMRGFRRLEKCYSISYQRFYGDITPGHCEYLTGQLKEMITRRFDERNQESDTLKRWEAIEKSLYRLILEKKASLFVVSHDNIPIAISISYHYNSLFFYYITSYDIDYSKFGLGHIVLIKQLDWCFLQKYRIFEMGWGELEYKRQWSNYIEDLQNIMYIPKNRPFLAILARCTGNSIRFKKYLLDKKGTYIFRLYKQLKNLPGRAPVASEQAYRLENTDELRTEGLIRIDPEIRQQPVFKSIMNDFIYHSEESFSKVHFYRDDKDNSYYVMGEKHGSKIIFDSHYNSFLGC